MAKASDNLFPYVHLVPAAAPASPAAGAQRIYLDSADGNKLKRKASDGSVTTIEGGSGGGTVAGSVLAFKQATASASYSISSNTEADVDATNLVVTFTAPASGNVTIDLEGLVDSSATPSAVFDWTVRAGTTTVGAATLGNPGYQRLQVSIPITGLTPGNAYTYKWGWRKIGGSAGTMTLYTGGNGGSSGNATMTVVQAL